MTVKATRKYGFLLRYFVFSENSKREGVLPPPPAWRAGERGQEIDRMGQTGSRVASKIANSFTFHGSPRYKIECEEKIR